MRGQRQQLVIEAILKKLTSVGSVTKVGNIIDDINGQFVTNLTFDDMLSFYKYGSDSEIEKLQIQGDDCYMEKVTIHVANPLVAAERITTIQIKELAKVTNDLRAHLGLPAYTKQTLIRKNKYRENKRI